MIIRPLSPFLKTTLRPALRATAGSRPARSILPGFERHVLPVDPTPAIPAYLTRIEAGEKEGPVSGPVVDEVAAALAAAIPYVLDAARRAERMGLEEECAAAWVIYRRAHWLVRAVQDTRHGNEGTAPLLKRTVEYED